MSSRLTSEIAEKQVGNKFLMVLLAAERAREISRGATSKVATKNGPTITAMSEIEAGHIDWSIMNRLGKRRIQRFRPIP